jgi:hypothetical protein
VTTHVNARNDPALAWLAARLRWERRLERLRLRHEMTGRARPTDERAAA